MAGRAHLVAGMVGRNDLRKRGRPARAGLVAGHAERPGIRPGRRFVGAALGVGGERTVARLAPDLGVAACLALGGLRIVAVEAGGLAGKGRFPAAVVVNRPGAVMSVHAEIVGHEPGAQQQEHDQPAKEEPGEPDDVPGILESSAHEEPAWGQGCPTRQLARGAAGRVRVVP